MRNYDPEYSYSPTGSASQALAEASARTFMQRVYGWMAVGLGLTGAVAFFIAQSNSLMAMVLPLRFPLMLVQLGVVVAFSFIAQKISGPVAGALFLVYALLTGVTFSVLFLVYTQASIASAFFITAGTFGAMSVYGTVTKKDLSGWGSFLMMGLIGIIIAGIVNFFMHSDMMSFIISCATVVVFSGLTAYDTQKLRLYHANSGFSSASSLAITGALMLYLDFVNLFLAILRLMGRRR